MRPPQSSADIEPRRGAYGLHLPDLPGQRWLGPAPEEWPTWNLARRALSPAEAREQFGPDVVTLEIGSGRLCVDRRAGRTTIAELSHQPDAAFVHPILAATAVVRADWDSCLAFHGGAFLDKSGGAWGVLAERAKGKSTLLAALAQTGAHVLSDDLIVTDGSTVLRGPRCIDLREASAERLGWGEDLGVVGSRRRWRATLGDAPAEAPLAGWISLHWEDDVRVRPVASAERAELLSQNRGLFVSQQHPLAWLAVLSKPMLSLARPRSFAALDDAIAALSRGVDCIARGDEVLPSGRSE